MGCKAFDTPPDIKTGLVVSKSLAPFSHAHSEPVPNPDTKPVRSISTRLHSHGQFTYRG